MQKGVEGIFYKKVEGTITRFLCSPHHIPKILGQKAKTNHLGDSNGLLITIIW